MAFYAKLAGTILGLAGALLLCQGSALAAPAGIGTDDVVAQLGLASEPADYVLLVDTSGSMKQDGRYARVRKELRKLVGGLDSDDRVSLITFDTRATSRFRGVVGRKPDAVLAKLPAQASGQHTDIGAAIAAGLTELERADTHRLAALILITDGKLDVGDSSGYGDVKSAAWKKLKARAAELGTRHEVAAYAVSLMASTDAGLLKRVVPNATEVSAAEVGKQFAAMGGDLVQLQAAAALKEELSRPIRVTWTGDLGAALAGGGPVDAELLFTSPYPHVPVELSELSVRSSDGLTVELAGLPELVGLEPSGQAVAKVRATVTGSAGADANVSLAAKVTSPWSEALTELGVEFAPGVEGAAEIPPAPLKLPPTLLPTVGAAVGLLAAVAALVWLLRAATTPKLSGLLTFSRGGRPVADVVLDGRRMKLAAPAGSLEVAGLSGSVAGARGKGKGQLAVRLDARLGAARARGVIADGGVLQMGDTEIAYTSGRRRILDKISFPKSAPEPE